MKVWYHVHTYDMEICGSQLLGLPSNLGQPPIRWVYEHLEEVTYVAKWEIKEHTR